MQIIGNQALGQIFQGLGLPGFGPRALVVSGRRLRVKEVTSMSLACCLELASGGRGCACGLTYGLESVILSGFEAWTKPFGFSVPWKGSRST